MIMTYVKIFFSINYDDLEYAINSYANQNGEEIVSISLDGMYAAVVFREREKV